MAPTARRRSSTLRHNPCTPSWLYSRVDKKLANCFDRAFFGFRPRVRTVKDGGHAVQSSRNPAPRAFRYLAAQCANQRFYRRPANVRFRWASKDVVQRSLSRLVHGKGNSAFLVPYHHKYDSTFRYLMIGAGESWKLPTLHQLYALVRSLALRYHHNLGGASQRARLQIGRAHV